VEIDYRGNNTPLASNIACDLFGPLTSLTYRNGLSETDL
jgi:hypothetical protein